MEGKACIKFYLMKQQDEWRSFENDADQPLELATSMLQTDLEVFKELFLKGFHFNSYHSSLP